MIEQIPATENDVRSIASRLREADRQEIWLASGSQPLGVLVVALQQSEKAWVYTADGVPECVCGVVPGPVPSLGVPWMVGTPVMVKHQVALLREGRRVVQEMNEMYPTLWNLVSADSRTSIRWLKRLGFQLGDPIQHGPFNADFYPFMRFKDV